MQHSPKPCGPERLPCVEVLPEEIRLGTTLRFRAAQHMEPKAYIIHNAHIILRVTFNNNKREKPTAYRTNISIGLEIWMKQHVPANLKW